MLLTTAITPLVAIAVLKRHGYSARDILRLHEIIGEMNVKWYEAVKKRREYELSNDLGLALFLPLFAGWFLAAYTVFYGSVISVAKFVLFIFAHVSNVILFYLSLFLLAVYPFIRILRYDFMQNRSVFLVVISAFSALAAFFDYRYPWNPLLVSACWTTFSLTLFLFPENLKKMKIFTVTLILVAIPPLHASITCSPLVLIPYTFPYLAESCNNTYDTFFAAVILTIITATLSAFLVLRIFGYYSFREAFADTRKN